MQDAFGGPQRRVENIEISQIQVPTTARPIDDKIVPGLAGSIERDGLLQPVGVRLAAVPIATQPYELIFGQHRVEATKMLGKTTIPAFVFDDLSDGEAEAAAHAENLFRTGLSKSEYRIALAKWAATVRENHPETTEHRAGGKARARHAQRLPNGQLGPERDESVATVPALPKPVEAFYKAAAKLMKKHPATIRRDEHIGRKIGPDGLRLCEKHNVPEDHIRKLATLPADQRSAALSYIAMGVDSAEAIGSVEKNPVVVLEVPDGPPDQAKSDEELSDQAWVELHCKDHLERLHGPCKAKFTDDAILYRETREARQALREATKKSLSSRKNTVTGSFFHLLRRFLHVAHPSSWLVCGRCQGRGLAQGGGECQACYGNGYVVESERPRPRLRSVPHRPALNAGIANA
jgi:ParB/RepB/Spo0J family partition protein